MNAPAWVEMQLAKDADRVSDSLREQEIRLREAEYADTRTKAARAAIEGLGRNLTELEVRAIVSSLIGAIERAGWSHTCEAVTAVEYLNDARSVLENCNE